MIQKWQHLPWPHGYELWFWTTITRFAVWTIFNWRLKQSIFRYECIRVTEGKRNSYSMFFDSWHWLYASHDTNGKCFISIREKCKFSSSLAIGSKLEKNDALLHVGKVHACGHRRRWSIDVNVCLSSVRDRSLHVHRIEWNKSRKNLKRITQTLSALSNIHQG